MSTGLFSFKFSSLNCAFKSVGIEFLKTKKKNWFHEGGATLQQLRNPRRRWGHLTRSFRLPYCSSHFKFQCFSHLPRGWISFHYRMASADKIPSSNQRLNLHGTTARASSAVPTWRLGLLGKFEFDLVSIVAQTKRPYPLIATAQPSQSSLFVKRILLILISCCHVYFLESKC